MRKSEKQTKEHIQNVRALIESVVFKLRQRGLNHDKSKLLSPEVDILDDMMDLKEIEYGTPEYMDQVQLMVAEHCTKNDHHPEYYENGISGMSLISLMEMLCDWKDATRRTKGGHIDVSITTNSQRFNINPQLEAILRNTVKEMGW